MLVLQQGVQAGVGVRVIVTVVVEGVRGKVEKVRGSVSTSQTTVIAATGKRASGGMRKVVVRGTGQMQR